jgi:hypothetical protein
MQEIKKIAISQSNYIPWKGYFDLINSVDEFVLYDDMQYTKRDWRNRNKIKTKDGTQWLSIPVEVKGKYLQKINETKISDPKWGRSHWDSIYYNYKKAPYFTEYKDIFEYIYLDSKEELLSRVNYTFIKVVCSILKIKTEVLWSDFFELHADRNNRLIDICKKRDALEYYSGPSAKSYMDLSLFEKSNIAVTFYDYSGYPEYQQQFGDFDHAVTILDLLFNAGPNASKFMKSFEARE